MYEKEKKQNIRYKEIRMESNFSRFFLNITSWREKKLIPFDALENPLGFILNWNTEHSKTVKLLYTFVHSYPLYLAYC